MLVIFILLGLLWGILSRGRLRGLEQIRMLWLPIISILLQLPLDYFPGIFGDFKAVFLTASYGLMLLFFVFNYRYKLCSLIAGAGTILNFLVISLNGFRMPISQKAIEVYGLVPEEVAILKPHYFVATDGAKVLFLGDVIHVPIPYIGGFISVGDVLLGIGLMLLIRAAMANAKAK